MPVVRTAGTQTHTSCSAWRVPGALLLNPLFAPHTSSWVRAWAVSPGLVRGCTPTCPSSPPLSKVMTAHLISTIQGLLRATGRSNSKFRFRGERPKETTHVNHGEARQVKGHTQEDWATPHLYGSRRHPSACVFRVKHQSVEARGFLWLLLCQQAVRLKWHPVAPPHPARLVSTGLTVTSWTQQL